MERQGANQNLIYSSKSSAAAKLKIISRNSGMLEKKTQPSNVIPEPQHFYRYPDSNASLNSTRTQGIGAGLGVSQSPRAFRIGQTKKSIPFLAPGSTQVAQLGDLSLSNLYGNPDISLNVRKPFIGLQHQDRLQTGNPSPAPQSSNYFASSARGSATNASTNLANTNLQGVFSSSKTSKILDTSDGTEERYQSSLQKYLIMKPNKLGREVSPPSKAVYLPSPNTTQMGPSMLSSLVQSPVDTPETTNEKVRQQTRGTADKVSAFMPNLKLQSSPRVLSKQPSLIAKDNLLKTPVGMGASPMRMKIEIKPRKQDEAQEADTDGKNEQLTAGSSQTNKAGTKNGFTSALFFARSGSSSSLTSAAVMAQKEGLEQQQPPALNLTGAPVAKGETQPQETKPSPIPTVKLESGSLGKVPPREESTLPSPSRAHRFTIKWTANTWPKIEEEIRVDKLLGQGSFAKVYQGFDLVKKIIVAIKVLDKRKISEMGFNKMAEKELEVLQLVRHPNIGNVERMLEDKNRVRLGFNQGLHLDGALWWNDS